MALKVDELPRNFGESQSLIDNISTAGDSNTQPQPLRYAAQRFSNLLDEERGFRSEAKENKILSKRDAFNALKVVLAAVCVLAQLGFSIWAITVHPPERDVGTLFTGDCNLVARVNSGIHVLLNLIATTFLAMGNYCMQMCVAPTMEELKKAHQKGKSFEIGVHAFTNVFKISPLRMSLWLVLVLVSTTLHLTWNSAIFSSLPWVVYPTAFVTEDYTTASHEWWNQAVYTIPGTSDPPVDNDMLQRSANHTRLEPADCIQEFLDPFKASREVVVVLNTTSEQQRNSSKILTSYIASPWYTSNEWICMAEFYNLGYRRFCGSNLVGEFQDHWTVGVTSPPAMGVADDLTVNIPPQYLVQYCLVGEAADPEARCAFHYSFSLLIVIGACSMTELLLILAIVLMRRETPGMLVTGDVIAGSMQGLIQPLNKLYDQFTPSKKKGKKQRKQKQQTKQKKWRWSLLWLWRWLWRTAKATRPGSEHTATKTFWFTAMRTRSWTISAIVFTVALAACLTPLGAGLESHRIKGLSTSPAALWAEGLGHAQPYAMSHITFLEDLQPFELAFYSNVLFANGFQLLLSIEYLVYNNILTRQLVAQEMIGYFKERKALRVSRTEGGLQRESYFLSLPWRYALPLILLSTLLHWSVSQSVFVVQVDAWGPGPSGERMPALDSANTGYSVGAIFLSLALAVTAFLALFANSWRRFDPAPPGFAVKSCDSAELAQWSQCPEEDKDAYLYPVKLGFVRHYEASGEIFERRLVFTTDNQMEELT